MKLSGKTFLCCCSVTQSFYYYCCRKGLFWKLKQLFPSIRFYSEFFPKLTLDKENTKTNDNDDGGHWSFNLVLFNTNFLINCIWMSGIDPSGVPQGAMSGPLLSQHICNIFSINKCCPLFRCYVDSWLPSIKCEFILFKLFMSDGLYLLLYEQLLFPISDLFIWF